MREGGEHTEGSREIVKIPGKGEGETSEPKRTQLFTHPDYERGNINVVLQGRTSLSSLR